MNVNLKEHEHTNLRFKPVSGEIEINNNGDVNSDFNESTVQSSLNKRGKGLPSVGIIDNNFKPCKIKVGGKFNSENINMGNIMSANSGVNGNKKNNIIIKIIE